MAVTENFPIEILDDSNQMDQDRLDAETVININECILKWVKTCPLLADKRKKIDFKLTVDNIEDDLQIHQSTADYSNVELMGDKTGGSKVTTSESSSSKKRLDGDQIVFASKFVNNTNCNQTHHLSTERSTTATSNVSMDKTVINRMDRSEHYFPAWQK